MSMPDGLGQALLLGGLAGLTIPLGGALAAFEHLRPQWLEAELRHSVMAFGAGVLLAAVALVLVPESVPNLSAIQVAFSMTLGSIAFMLLDRMLSSSGGTWSQLLAMLLDFIPEAAALGALLTQGQGPALLLALLMALQNLPESFNAFRELQTHQARPVLHVLGVFSGLALLGPLAAWVGFLWLTSMPAVLSSIMLFASGGILYLIFQDIAPQVPLKRHWGPPLGAVLGFLLGLLGNMWIG